ncbi:MAG: NAD-dependent epimerase/dehydratase family protein [Bacteroidales bacterium]|nr:NAD-dependent epimerase/dehydratase family protein [Bacteroidales bacterium]
MILVTGGTGLTGSHLLLELTQKGYFVRAIKRNNSSTTFVKKIFSLYSLSPNELLNRIDWIDADLLDYSSLLDATRGIETVYHTGALVSFNPKDAEAITETNIRGTANIVDACVKNHVKNLCHMSSIASLGEANEHGFIDESCIWTKNKGKSAYSKSKFFGEMEVWRGAEMGLRIIIVNPSVILGPGRWNTGSGQFFSRIYKGLPFYTDGIGGYIDVRDVVKAMILLNENQNIQNERFILSSENLNYQDIFSLIAKNLGKKPPHYQITPRMVSVFFPIIKLFGVFIGKGSAISRESLNSAFSKSYYSSEKTKKSIGFQFLPISESVQFIGSVFRKGSI